jgi:hypothetical protein
MTASSAASRRALSRPLSIYRAEIGSIAPEMVRTVTTLLWAKAEVEKEQKRREKMARRNFIGSLNLSYTIA